MVQTHSSKHPMTHMLNVCFFIYTEWLHGHRLHSHLKGYFQVTKRRTIKQGWHATHKKKLLSSSEGSEGRWVHSVLVAKHRGQMSQYRILSANDVCLFMIIREQTSPLSPPSPTPSVPCSVWSVSLHTYKLWALYGMFAYFIPQKKKLKKDKKRKTLMWSTWNTMEMSVNNL